MTPLISDRPNLSQEVAELIREMIFDGTLQEGVPVNEVQLASRLGVSRTPLREALSALVAEKAIDQVARRGFFVRALTVQEAKEIYSIRQILDLEALKQAGLPPKETLDELNRINIQLSECKGTKEAIQLDDKWHLTLLRDCPNKTLMELIQNLILRTRRYELGVMGRSEVLNLAVQTHQKTIEALRLGRLDEGIALLRENLGGAKFVQDWLADKESR